MTPEYILSISRGGVVIVTSLSQCSVPISQISKSLAIRLINGSKNLQKVKLKTNLAL